MKPKKLKGEMLLAVGSVMDVSPCGDYSEYLPSGTTSQRLGARWRAVGRAINGAIKHHAAENGQAIARRA